MAKLEGTSQTSIAITFLVMNLVAALRQIFCVLFGEEDEKVMCSAFSIKGDYQKTVKILDNLLMRAVSFAPQLSGKFFSNYSASPR